MNLFYPDIKIEMGADCIMARAFHSQSTAWTAARGGDRCWLLRQDGELVGTLPLLPEESRADTILRIAGWQRDRRSQSPRVM